MIIKLAVFTEEGWTIESYTIFDSCLWCGWVREKTNEATYTIKGKKTRAHWAKCGCNYTITECEAIMEDIIINELKSRNIICNEVT